jgi:hypothetical protein
LKSVLLAFPQPYTLNQYINKKEKSKHLREKLSFYDEGGVPTYVRFMCFLRGKYQLLKKLSRYTPWKHMGGEEV